MTFPILTVHVSNNAEVFREIMELYVPEGALVADVTFGTGAFYKSKRIPMKSWRFSSSDIKPNEWLQADFRCLPYRDETFDAAVFDPPYGQMSTAPRRDGVAKGYNTSSARDIYYTEHLYREGILEADRILKPKGILIVKCQDQINSGKQCRWSHFVYGVCSGFLGMEDLDQFVVVRKNTPMMRHKHQIHARKNHSFFWVFRKKR